MKESTRMAEDPKLIAYAQQRSSSRRGRDLAVHTDQSAHDSTPRSERLYRPGDVANSCRPGEPDDEVGIRVRAGERREGLVAHARRRTRWIIARIDLGTAISSFRAHQLLCQVPCQLGLVQHSKVRGGSFPRCTRTRSDALKIAWVSARAITCNCSSHRTSGW